MRTPDRRGVSEAISFVLVFSLIVGTVGVVYAVGFSGLQDVRDDQRVNNAERAFDVLAHNVEDLTRRSAPTRGTEIHLADATLGSGEPTYINVSGTDATHPDFTSGNVSIEPIVYYAEETRIRYAAGAVIRIQPGGATMLGEPNFVVSKQHVVVPLVQLDVKSGSVGGTQTVYVRTETELRRLYVSKSVSYDTVTITVTSPARDAWAGYLEGQGMTCTTVTSRKVSCSLSDVSRTTVNWFLISVTID